MGHDLVEIDIAMVLTKIVNCNQSFFFDRIIIGATEVNDLVEKILVLKNELKVVLRGTSKDVRKDP